jgi:hypothetical protein
MPFTTNVSPGWMPGAESAVFLNFAMTIIISPAAARAKKTITLLQ